QQGRIMLLDEPFTGVDVKTEEAIIDLLRELRAQGHTVLVSTHDLGSVPEYCDQVVIINRTVLAAGPMATTFTEANLMRAFGGALRNVKLDHTDQPGSTQNEYRVLTDDEGALVFDQNGQPKPRTPSERRKAV
ncbi:MAG: iron ABC transporter permease, partial [Planctomycetota bacterium]|nr:iron ABC transporter permease [Planctomycetota bacterium]